MGSQLGVRGSITCERPTRSKINSAFYPAGRVAHTPYLCVGFLNLATTTYVEMALESWSAYPPESPKLCRLDHTHAAATELLQDAIVRNGLADHG